MKKSEYESLKQAIESVHTVSFDIFDTAILRNVIEPTDIFTIVEKFKGIKGFTNKRIRAELKARKNSNEEDITIDEIYKYLPYNPDIERDVELDFCIGNKVILDLYRYAVSKNKKVIFISDMYLDEATIKKILERCGYTSYDGLYISGVVKKSKATGTLYQYVKAKHDLSTDTWLHLGDNEISDINNAKKLGIRTYYYCPVRKKYEKHISRLNIERSIIKAVQINHLESIGEIDYWNKFAILYISHLMYLFTAWIAENVKNQKNKKIHFLSRDGYIPYLLYQIIREAKTNLPMPNYLYASRGVYQYSELSKFNKEECIEYISAINPALGFFVSPRDIFSRYGLNMEVVVPVCRKHGLELDEKVTNHKQHESLKKVINELFDEIEGNTAQEYSKLNKYLENSGLSKKQELDFIVDVGWRGSIQKAIENIKKMKLRGLYFGTIPQVYTQINNRVLGFVFDKGKPRKYYKYINDNIMMFEFVFSAPHGSLIGFRLDPQNNDVVVPILDTSEEQNNNLIIKREIRDGVISTSRKLIKYHDYIKSSSVEDAIYDYFKFIKKKNIDDLIAFSKVQESLGVSFYEQGSPFVSNYTQETFNSNYKDILKNAQKNLWKGAFLIEHGKGEMHLKSKLYSYSLGFFHAVKLIIIFLLNKLR
ncbi:HAD family hydrolase [Vibrio cholerae]